MKYSVRVNISPEEVMHILRENIAGGTALWRMFSEVWPKHRNGLYSGGDEKKFWIYYNSGFNHKLFAQKCFFGHVRKIDHHTVIFGHFRYPAAYFCMLLVFTILFFVMCLIMGGMNEVSDLRTFAGGVFIFVVVMFIIGVVGTGHNKRVVLQKMHELFDEYTLAGTRDNEKM